MKAVTIAALMLSATPVLAEDVRIEFPLSTANQAAVIPMLCDSALYGERARWDSFCAQAKTALAAAAKAEADKAKAAPAEPKKD